MRISLWRVLSSYNRWATTCLISAVRLMKVYQMSFSGKACQEKRLLITTDRGFAHYRSKEHHGILIVSLRRPNRLKINERVIEAMKLFSPEKWSGLLVVMRDKTMSTWRRGK